MAEETRAAVERRNRDQASAADDFAERPEGSDRCQAAMEFMEAIKDSDIRYNTRTAKAVAAFFETLSGHTMEELFDAADGEGGMMAMLGLTEEGDIHAATRPEDGDEIEEIDLDAAVNKDKQAVGDPTIPGIDISGIGDEPESLVTAGEFETGDLVHRKDNEKVGGMVVGVLDDATVSVRIFGGDAPPDPQNIPAADLVEGFEGEVG